MYFITKIVVPQIFKRIPKYCKSDNIRDVLIFIIFAKWTVSEILKSARVCICNIQTYIRKKGFVKNLKIHEIYQGERFRRNKNHATIKGFTVVQPYIYLKPGVTIVTNPTSR